MKVVVVAVLLGCVAALTPSPNPNPNYNPRAAYSRTNPNNWGPYGYPLTYTNPYLYGPHDPACNCHYTYRGPHGYYDFWVLSDIVFGTYHDADHWTPDPATEIVPCTVCYVDINGRGVVFIDRFTFVNSMTVGRDVWDDAFVIVGGRNRGASTTLKIFYDRTPEIFLVEGTRQTTGQTLLQIVGKSFGFNAQLVTVNVINTAQAVPQASCYPNAGSNDNYPLLKYSDPGFIDPHHPPNPAPGLEKNIKCPGIPSVVEFPGSPITLEGNVVSYNCHDVRIYYRDSHISCLLDLENVQPQELQVVVSVQFEPNRDGTLTDPVVATSYTLTDYWK